MHKNKHSISFQCDNCGKVWIELIPAGCFVDDNVIYSNADLCSIKTIICPKCKSKKITKK